jgi:hypothetical protein
LLDEFGSASIVLENVLIRNLGFSMLEMTMRKSSVNACLLIFAWFSASNASAQWLSEPYGPYTGPSSVRANWANGQGPNQATLTANATLASDATNPFQNTNVTLESILAASGYGTATGYTIVRAEASGTISLERYEAAANTVQGGANITLTYYPPQPPLAWPAQFQPVHWIQIIHTNFDFPAIGNNRRVYVADGSYWAVDTLRISSSPFYDDIANAVPNTITDGPRASPDANRVVYAAFADYVATANPNTLPLTPGTEIDVSTNFVTWGFNLVVGPAGSDGNGFAVPEPSSLWYMTALVCLTAVIILKRKHGKTDAACEALGGVK